MKPYRPSNKAPLLGVILLALYTIVGGLAMGALVFGVSQVVYLVFLFPMVIGATGGVVVAAAIKRGKIRSPAVAVVFAVLIGLLMYGSYRYFDYLAFRSAVRTKLAQSVQEQLGRDDPAIVEEIIDLNLARQTGMSGFGGYILLSGMIGESFGRVGGPTANAGSFLTWAYWLVEISIIVGLSIIIARPAAGKLFCEVHNRWYNQSQHLGGVDASEGAELLDSIQAGDYARIGGVLQEETALPSLEVYIENCADCLLSDSCLSVDRLFSGSRGRVQRKQLLQTMISSSEVADLMRGIQAHRVENQFDSSSM